MFPLLQLIDFHRRFGRCEDSRKHFRKYGRDRRRVHNTEGSQLSSKFTAVLWTISEKGQDF